ncbi:MAG TPA: DnrO protein [Rhodanobacteraceae bacterium]|nr:DnrO protein [Rhodanobacteraceae bacterium]
MTPTRTVVALALALALALPAALLPGMSRAQHHHDAQAHAQETLATPPAQRYAADIHLKDGITRIHAALEQLGHYETGPVDTVAVREQVKRIDAAAADIFAKCKLAPDADAALHGMLLPLLGAANKLRDNPRDVPQVAVMREAIAAYPHYFDAPDFDAGEAHAH